MKRQRHDVMNFDDLIKELLWNGFTIEVKLNEHYDVGFEIQTGAKSNLTIFKDDYNLCTYISRYQSGVCENKVEFLYTLKECLCGKDFANKCFYEYLVKKGVMNKIVEQKVKYE